MNLSETVPQNSKMEDEVNYSKNFPVCSVRRALNNFDDRIESNLCQMVECRRLLQHFMMKA